MIAKTDVLDVAPELSGLTDSQWNRLIGYAYAQMSPSTWDDWLDMGAVYLVAHMATLTMRGGSGGVISSESVGQVSRSYALPPHASIYASTVYGQEFERMARTIPAARLPVIG